MTFFDAFLPPASGKVTRSIADFNMADHQDPSHSELVNGASTSLYPSSEYSEELHPRFKLREQPTSSQPNGHAAATLDFVPTDTTEEYKRAQRARPEASPPLAAVRGGNTNFVPAFGEAQHTPEIIVTTPDIVNTGVIDDVRRKKPSEYDDESKGSSTVHDYGLSQRLNTVPGGVLTQENKDHLVGQTGQIFEDHEPSQPTSIDGDLEFSSLRKSLRAKTIDHPHKEKGFFLPLDALDSVITPESVIDELHRSKPDLKQLDGVSFEEISDFVCKKHHMGSRSTSGEKYTSGRKLFAILLLIEKPEAITQFIAENLSDKDLPFELERTGGDLRLSRKNGTSIRAFHGWKDVAIENFETYQWYMLSPFFSKPDKANKVFYYPLETKILLPFIESDERKLATSQSGGYGTVFRVRIHQAHHNFDSPKGENPSFAVKKLMSSDEAAFQQEVDTLKRFSINSHKHLIKLLATYKHANSYHLIFPWADSNLRRFWDLNPKPKIDGNLSRWMAGQCHGLAVGLSKIHHYQSSSDPKNLAVDSGSSSNRKPYGRHSDIKPENILWFQDPKSLDKFSGVLKISDFGLTQFNSRLSRSGIPNKELYGTPTYRPPECDLPEDSISQSYDMWALGCLYLEFITWVLKGSDAVNDTFADHRIRDGSSSEVVELKEDTFFTIEQNAAYLKRSVLRWIDGLHFDINCTDYLHELLDFILVSLLMPDPQQRAKCPSVVEKLDAMCKRCHEDEKYCTASAPRKTRSPSPQPYYGSHPKRIADTNTQHHQAPILDKPIQQSPRQSLESGPSRVSSLRSNKGKERNFSVAETSPKINQVVRFSVGEKPLVLYSESHHSSTLPEGDEPTRKVSAQKESTDNNGIQVITALETLNPEQALNTALTKVKDGALGENGSPSPQKSRKTRPVAMFKGFLGVLNKFCQMWCFCLGGSREHTHA